MSAHDARVRLLAADAEAVAIDADALAKRIASMDLPRRMQPDAQAQRASNAARVLCEVAQALHGGQTDALRLFFTDTSQPSLRERRAKQTAAEPVAPA